MNADTLGFRGASRLAVIVLALLLASCIKSTHKIGGTVSGMTGTGLTLQNNGGDNLSIAANGPFTFSNALKKDSSYSVTVFRHPSGQTCTVNNGSGRVTSTVTDVRVDCAAGGGFTVGGSTSGLTGTGLVLQNNGGNNLSIAANGSFTFSATVASGAAYNVTVSTQPSGQNCTVNNGSGTATANVTNVAVSCVAVTYTVGGAVSGLAGTGLVLQNNGGNNLSIAGDGAFTFSTGLVNGASYSVTVLSQPAGQTCSVANGSGTIASANVSNVAVTCVSPPPAAPNPSLSFGVKELRFSWPAASGATFYKLLEDPDGIAGYSEVAANITSLSYNYAIPVHRRLNASYIVEACNSGGCTDSAPMTVAANLAQAIGYIKASNPAIGDQFGIAVAASGDGNTFAVGAYLQASAEGAVYVYARVGGAWSQQALLKAASRVAGDQFGTAVALSDDGNTLAIGAVGRDAGAGAAYVYTRSGGNWTEQPVVKASNPEAGDMFGWTVALSGDGNTLAVGSPFESGASIGVTAGSVDELTAGNLAGAAGAVYVYARSGGAFSQQAYVKASNTQSMDLFGYSVGLAGDGSTLAVGAPQESSNLTDVTPGPVNEASSGNGAVAAGAVYVYTRTGTAWSQHAYVKASNTGAGDNFGTSVALSSDGGTLAVGAPMEDSGSSGIDSTPNDSVPNAGAAYVYTRLVDTWSQQAYVKASNPGANDNFGTSVALSADGGALAVGSPFEDSITTGIGSTPLDFGTDSGAVYFYSRSAGAWSQESYVKATNTGDQDQFGWSVALSGDGNTLVVGASLEDSSNSGIGGTSNDSAANAGAAYLY